MRTVFGLVGLASIALLAGGCAHAEFDLVGPPDMVQHIGTKGWTTVTADPLEYRMTAYEDHLIVRAYNHGETPIRLLADQGTIVDPGGQSHPLATPNQNILPGSYIKLILPPNHAALAPTGPSIQFGFGALFGGAWPRRRYFSGLGYGYDPIWYDSPRYYTVYVGDDAALWNWRDGGTVRVVLPYERVTESQPPATQSAGTAQDAGRFRHEFSFRKVSVK